MKKVRYWCLTKDGEKFFSSKKKLDTTNKNQMDWVKREIGDDVFLIVELTRARLNFTKSEFYRYVENLLLGEQLQMLKSSLESMYERLVTN